MKVKCHVRRRGKENKKIAGSLSIFWTWSTVQWFMCDNSTLRPMQNAERFMWAFLLEDFSLFLIKMKCAMLLCNMPQSHRPTHDIFQVSAFWQLFFDQKKNFDSCHKKLHSKWPPVVDTNRSNSFIFSVWDFCLVMAALCQRPSIKKHLF